MSTWIVTSTSMAGLRGIRIATAELEGLCGTWSGVLSDIFRVRTYLLQSRIKAGLMISEKFLVSCKEHCDPLNCTSTTAATTVKWRVPTPTSNPVVHVKRWLACEIQLHDGEGGYLVQNLPHTDPRPDFVRCCARVQLQLQVWLVQSCHTVIPFQPGKNHTDGHLQLSSKK